MHQFERYIIFSMTFVCTTAIASPFTYQFTNNSGYISTINLTFDNGSSTNTNQTYTWANITDFSAATLDGKFDIPFSTNTTLSTSNSSFGDPAATLLVTNASGTSGTFLFNTISQQQPILANIISTTFEVGPNYFSPDCPNCYLQQSFYFQDVASSTREYEIGFTSDVVYGAPPNFYTNSEKINYYGSISTDALSATLVSAVPLPPAVIMFASGLIGLGAFRKKFTD